MIKVTDYYMSDCGPCKLLDVILAKIDSNNDDVELVKVDCEQNSDEALDKNIRSVPTLIITSDGAEECRLNGLKTEAEILEVIDGLR